MRGRESFVTLEWSNVALVWLEDVVEGNGDSMQDLPARTWIEATTSRPQTSAATLLIELILSSISLPLSLIYSLFDSLAAC